MNKEQAIEYWKNTKTNRWSKKNVQQVLKDIRSFKRTNKLSDEAVKIESFPNEMLRYRISFKNKVVFEALNGNHDYLVRYHRDAFKKA